MTAYRDDVDEDNDDWDDDGDSVDDSADDATVPCPYCRREILEDSPRCPYCEQYISAEDTTPARKPLWVIVAALICLGMVLWWLF